MGSFFSLLYPQFSFRSLWACLCFFLPIPSVYVSTKISFDHDLFSRELTRFAQRAIYQLSSQRRIADGQTTFKRCQDFYALELWYFVRRSLSGRLSVNNFQLLLLCLISSSAHFALNGSVAGHRRLQIILGGRIFGGETSFCLRLHIRSLAKVEHLSRAQTWDNKQKDWKLLCSVNGSVRRWQ